MYFHRKDCSKNNSLLERVDPSVQHIWRFRVMGSWPAECSDGKQLFSSRGWVLARKEMICRTPKTDVLLVPENIQTSPTPLKFQ